MSFTAGRYNMNVDQGATFERVITWNDSAGNPVNLGGYTARMQVRQRFVSPTTVLSLTTGSGITLGGALGTITLLASASTTAQIATGEYLYDLELVSGGGVVTRLLQGLFTVNAEVTR
jgi:hypothetical protein